MGAEMKINKTSPQVYPQFNPLKNQRGMAVIESVTLIIIFLTLFWYTIGFWGIVHTSIVQSMASRTYAFEIFRHRSNLWYFRTNTKGDLKYHAYASRVHGTNSDSTPNGDKRQYATERRIAMFQTNEPEGRSTSSHEKAFDEVSYGQRNTTVSLDPVWIKIQYGLCLTAACGGD